MILHAPLQISPRLMPGVRIGDSWLSLECGPWNAEGRTVYRAFIDWRIDDRTGEYEVLDLRSGVGGGGVQEGIGALLSFLSAAAEAYDYTRRTGRESDNADLFPPDVTEWAYQISDEIAMLANEIEESETPLVED